MRRSKFNLGHYRLATMDMGYLVPIGLMEVLPGDTFRQSTSALVRFSPLAAPVMHPIEVRIHHFFVPHRIIWDGWEDFITGGEDGNDASTPPQFGASATIQKGQLLNYYGIPSGTTFGAGEISSLPSSGYARIFNEYYRDQDLVPEMTVDITQMPQRVSWEKDYFTSARPWTQKGDEIVLPIGETAPVVPGSPQSWPSFKTATEGSIELWGEGASTNAAYGAPVSSSRVDWEASGLVTDLSQATGVSVNDFRRAFALQRYAEARARYGSRYTEYLRYLGITPSDARLQRPEYLGGARVAMNISEVLQTAPEIQEAQPREYGVGDLYGHGVGAIRQRPYRRFFEEHGYVHSLMSIRPKTLYQDAVPRHWRKIDREEYWQKELMQIGQQEIWNGEVYSNAAEPRGTFGYQDRYQEYKTQPSQVSGDFEDTLNYWHLARKFQQEPVLNQSFVECDPSKRIFNEQTQQSCWVMVNHRIAARRLVKKSGASRIL